MESDLTTVLRTLSERDDDLKHIMDHYGDYSQCRKLIEEMHELEEAITDLNSEGFVTEEFSDHEIEEAADVMIVLCQFIAEFYPADKMANMINFKIDRTLKRIEDETGKDRMDKAVEHEAES